MADPGCRKMHGSCHGFPFEAFSAFFGMAATKGSQKKKSAARKSSRNFFEASFAFFGMAATKGSQN